ncbi:hypothetical protein DYB32_009957 [Aphanomyces invadans]|uniref:JmjC domain-containing protein n=1 Tax=Aphanomyces invadans TaxID=157072 RepID=A0A3R7CXI3_9STRA|nr:hypothetical protein DYB32_009957 [Aphanomyces invadans]
MEKLVARFGDILCRVTHNLDVKAAVRMTLSDFAAYAAAQHDDSPLYIFDPHFGASMPSLLSDYVIPNVFNEDLLAVLPLEMHTLVDLVAGHTWSFPIPGHHDDSRCHGSSGASWHVDPAKTSAWNALLVGRKRWALYPPGLDSHNVTCFAHDLIADGNVERLTHIRSLVAPGCRTHPSLGHLLSLHTMPVDEGYLNEPAMVQHAFSETTTWQPRIRSVFADTPNLVNAIEAHLTRHPWTRPIQALTSRVNPTFSVHDLFVVKWFSPLNRLWGECHEAHVLTLDFPKLQSSSTVRHAPVDLLVDVELFSGMAWMVAGLQKDDAVANIVMALCSQDKGLKTAPTQALCRDCSKLPLTWSSSCTPRLLCQLDSYLPRNAATLVTAATPVVLLHQDLTDENILGHVRNASSPLVAALSTLPPLDRTALEAYCSTHGIQSVDDLIDVEPWEDETGTSDATRWKLFKQFHVESALATSFVLAPDPNQDSEDGDDDRVNLDGDVQWTPCLVIDFADTKTGDPLWDLIPVVFSMLVSKRAAAIAACRRGMIRLR